MKIAAILGAGLPDQRASTGTLFMGSWDNRSKGPWFPASCIWRAAACSQGEGVPGSSLSGNYTHTWVTSGCKSTARGCFHRSGSMRQSSCRRVSSDKRPTNPVWRFLPQVKGTATPARPDRTGSPARREPRRTRQADREPTRSAADARQAPEASVRAAFGRVDSRRCLRQQHPNAARNRKTEGGAD